MPKLNMCNVKFQLYDTQSNLASGSKNSAIHTQSYSTTTREAVAAGNMPAAGAAAAATATTAAATLDE